MQPPISIRPSHFADLIRVAQIIFDPSGGLSGREVDVDWETFGLSDAIVENLRQLGQKYQFASPHLAPESIWNELTPESRNWFINHKDDLWELEEAFPARDED